jgi:hypothetical protein
MRALLGSIGGLVLAAAVVAGPAHADAAVYQAGAEADGLRASVEVHHFLVVSDLADVGVPTASAAVDSLGDSQGFAADPDPGSTVLTAGGLVESGGGPQVPPYPLAVASSYPSSPSAAAGSGPYALRATSGPSSSSADASAGGGTTGPLTAGLVRAEASVAFSGGAARADASSVEEALEVAGVLRIGEVRSSAAVVARPGRRPEAETSFAAEGVTVAGVSVGVGPKGLVAAGTDVPLPSDSALRQVLGNAGITVHYLRGAERDGVAVSPGLEIDVVRQVSGVGEPVARYLLGESAADASVGLAPGGEPGLAAGTTTGSASGSSAGAPPGAAPRTPALGLPGASQAPAAGSTGGLSPASQAPGAAPAAVAAGAGSSGSFGPAAATRATSPGLPRATGGGPVPPAVPAGASSSIGGFYALLVLAAVALVGGSQLVRVLGVRLGWR